MAIGWRGPRRARREDDTTTVIDLDDRLAAYVSSDVRSVPDPERVRASFRRKRPDPEPEPVVDTFARRFTTESLFVWTKAPAADTIVDLRDPYDAYVVLGVPPGAPWDEVVRAHRSLARRNHPDRHIGSPEDVRRKADAAIRNVNAAYELLERRRQRSSNNA